MIGNLKELISYLQKMEILFQDPIHRERFKFYLSGIEEQDVRDI